MHSKKNNILFRFTLILFHLSILFFVEKTTAQIHYKLFINSNVGNDNNPGNSPALPKKNIEPSIKSFETYANTNGTVDIGLKAGNIFNETVTPGFPVQVGAYYDKNDPNYFAILNGSDEFNTGWEKLDNQQHIYKQAIKFNGFKGLGINIIGQYSFVYVTEIDKELENKSPFSARKILKLVSSISSLDNTPGAYYEDRTTADENPKTIYIHTSDGNSPNGSLKYRYEVTVRDRAFNCSATNNNKFENLWVRGYGAGHGSLPSRENSYYNKIIFGPGAAIHHVVVGSGIINRSLFLPGPVNTNGYAVVFYNTEGFKKRNKISNCIFLDIKTPIYTHTSGRGSMYQSLELNNIVAYANSEHNSGFAGRSNTDSMIINNVYEDGYQYAFVNVGPFLNISNSSFINCQYGIQDLPYWSKTNINNSFFKVNTDFEGIAIKIGNATNLTLSNSILHVKSEKGAITKGTGGLTNHINSTGNIFIAETLPDNSLTAATASIKTTTGKSNDLWDNNVYVLLSGKNLLWEIFDADSLNGRYQISDLKKWQQISGQDKNSLFFDLRNDPIGLKAIFADPENGDYTIANTKEGNQIKALKAGMTDPITCFLKKPTYEEAATIIKNEEPLSVHSCRNPCLENKIRISSSFNTTLQNKRQIRLDWTIGEEFNINHFEIERSHTDIISFEKIASMKPTGNSLYTFTDYAISPLVIYDYRLVVVAKNGERCYSYINTITVTEVEKPKKTEIYPNPTTGKFVVAFNDYNGPMNFIVCNAFGQTVFTKKLNIISGTPQTIDITNQPKGVYWLKIQTEDGVLAEKIILQ